MRISSAGITSGGITSATTRRKASRAGKSRQTREDLVAAARRLFAERGFAEVTLGQIGAGAGVSGRTVSSYFASKEALFFADSEPVDDRLLTCVRQRAAGESAFEAIRRHAVLSSYDLPGMARAVRERPDGTTVCEAIETYQSSGTPAAAPSQPRESLPSRGSGPGPGSDASAGGTVGRSRSSHRGDQTGPEAAQARVYLGSEQLRAYVHERFGSVERVLAELLAEETSAEVDDPLPGVAAAALLAPLRYAFGNGLELVASGRSPEEVARRRGQQLKRAYDLLGPALAGYARRAPAP